MKGSHEFRQEFKEILILEISNRIKKVKRCCRYGKGLKHKFVDVTDKGLEYYDYDTLDTEHIINLKKNTFENDENNEKNYDDLSIDELLDIIDVLNNGE